MCIRDSDDQVPRLEAGGDAIDVAEARGDAGDLDARFVERRDSLEALLEQLLDVAELARDAVLRDGEDDLLGPVDELGYLTGAVVAEGCDLLTTVDESAQDRHLVDDAGVVTGVGARRNQSRQLVDPRAPAYFLQLAELVQLVGEGDRVDRLASSVEGECRPVDAPVALPVEVLRPADLRDRSDRAGCKQHRAEDVFLSLDILRRHARRLDKTDGSGRHARILIRSRFKHKPAPKRSLPTAC